MSLPELDLCALCGSTPKWDGYSCPNPECMNCGQWKTTNERSNFYETAGCNTSAREKAILWNRKQLQLLKEKRSRTKPLLTMNARDEPMIKPLWIDKPRAPRRIIRRRGVMND